MADDIFGIEAGQAPYVFKNMVQRCICLESLLVDAENDLEKANASLRATDALYRKAQMEANEIPHLRKELAETNRLLGDKSTKKAEAEDERDSLRDEVDDLNIDIRLLIGYAMCLEGKLLSAVGLGSKGLRANYGNGIPDIFKERADGS